MGFIQLIEFTTTRPGEVETLVDEWLTQTQNCAARHVHAGQRAAKHLSQLCDGPMLFRNFDVRRV